MDDFGTGYSSLSHMRKFPFDKIKIDKSFVVNLGRGGDAEKIIAAIIGLGASLGMALNAEGIEKQEQAEWLRDNGCDGVQGYYFGKPMTSYAIKELLEDERWLKAENHQKRPGVVSSMTRIG